MEVKYVVAGVNESYRYLACVPFFIKAWEAVDSNVEVKVVLFAKSIPSFLHQYENNIVLIAPVEGVSTAFCSQIVRLFYPSLLPNDGAVLISDIDLLSLSSDYFRRALAECGDDSFVTTRSDHMKKKGRKEIVMCYNAAYPKVWSELTGVNTLDDMFNIMKRVFDSITYEDKHNGKGWRTDQLLLYKLIHSWKGKESRYIEREDAGLGFTRMNPNLIPIKHGVKAITDGLVTDLHINKELFLSGDIQVRNSYIDMLEKYINALQTVN